MSKYDEIKMLVEASRKALSGKMTEVNTNNIRKQYSLIKEQVEETEVDVDVDMGEDKKDSEEIGEKTDKQKTYKVLGNIMVLHGKTKADLQLTTDEKTHSHLVWMNLGLRLPNLLISAN